MYKLDFMYAVKMDTLPSLSRLQTVQSGVRCSAVVGLPSMRRRVAVKQAKEKLKRGGSENHKHIIWKEDVVARAGMGRISGAVHGSRSKKGRRRRAPILPEEEGSEDDTENELSDDVDMKVPYGDMLFDEIFDTEVDHLEPESEDMFLDNHAYDDINVRPHSMDQSSSPKNDSNRNMIQQEQSHLVESGGGRKSAWIADANKVNSEGNGDPYFARPREPDIKKAEEGKASRGKKRKKIIGNNGGASSPGKIDDIVEDTAPAATIGTAPSKLPRIKNDGHSDCVHIGENFKSTIDMKQVLAETESQKYGNDTNQNVICTEITQVRIALDAESPAGVLESLEDVSSAVGEDRKVVGHAKVGNETLGDIHAKLGILHADASVFEGQEVKEGAHPKKLCRFTITKGEDLRNENKDPQIVRQMAGVRSEKISKDLSFNYQQIPWPQALPQEMIEENSHPGQLVKKEIGTLSSQTIAQDGQVVGMPNQVTEQVSEVVMQVAEVLQGPIKDHLVQVEKLPIEVVEQVSQVAEHTVQIGQTMVDQVAEALPDPVVDKAGQAAEQLTQAAEKIAEQVVDPVTTTALHVSEQVSSQIVSFFSSDEKSDDSDDEFEAFRSSDLPEFKGFKGLHNFSVLQENQGLLSAIYDFYLYMLKKPLPEFVMGMFAAPILLSMIFTLLYLPEFHGLALEETAREFFESSGATADVGPSGLQITWQTVFQVFMFSVSLSTGLQPELAPLSPYTLVVANVNALVAQLIFVFLSGAVFARLSQPSQPIRCSTVAVICPPVRNRRRRPEACFKVLMARYVLAGPQPCELVDVKVDFTYKYNAVTRSGAFFRATQSLKLVKAEMAYLNHGMLVRHVIDETSPLYRRTKEMLRKEDAVFALSVIGLERSSMQSVFHVQHYCVYDGDVIWNAEFEDMILINKKNRRIVDHSLLSKWRSLEP